MLLRLLGTGPPAGWPNPFCGCAGCVAAADEPRGGTAALAGEELLLDCAADTPAAAARQRSSLARLRWLLLTRPAHGAELELLHRARADAATAGPLEVLAPAAAGPAGGVPAGRTGPLTAVAAGDLLARGRYVVRALPTGGGDRAGAPLAYALSGAAGGGPAPAGGRRDGPWLLYAAGGAPAGDAWAPAGGYDLVLLAGPGSTAYPDEAAFGTAVAALRSSGAVRAGSRLLAVGVGHRSVPPAELRRRLELAGAELPGDGSVLELGLPGPGPDPARGTGLSEPHPRRVLVTGGARSGKSAEAERRLAAEPEVLYLATGAAPGPDDPDWGRRVAAHRERRPAHWNTVETTDPVPLLGQPGPPVLLDCLALWLAAHLDDQAAADALVRAVRHTPRTVVLVTNEVGSGVHPASSVGRSFRDQLGRLNQRVAAECDQVWQVVAGCPVRLR